MPNGAGDPIEKEELLGREIAVGCNQAMHVMVPDLEGHLIGEKEPSAGVVVEELASGRLGG